MHNEKELDKEVIKLIQKGDDKTFRMTFDAYFPGLLAFAKEYVQDEEVAKNLVQEAFVKLWEKRETLSEDSNIKAFLYHILRNSSLNYLKGEKVRKKYEDRLKHSYNEALLNYEALNRLDFDSLSFEELANVISETINSLPPKCKQVFEMSRYQSLKNREIAEELGISVKAVEGHISKALKELRSELKKQFPSGLISILISFV
ncbi:RNA polymerase sigma-70 factor [Puteibacter caeruleilacunae]|nr:RNA polymerase sigma-70 factor [Puteibacter caeruleilacunae]